MIRNRIAATTAVALAAAVLAGCTIASPTPQNQGMNYTNGPFEGRAFASCDNSGERNVDGAFNDHYFYPKGQRTFAFSVDKGADTGPLSVATKDSIELLASGLVAFHLNTDCEKWTDEDGREWPGGRMQKFHEQYGSKKYDGQVAYSTDEGDDNGGPGWAGFVNVNVKSVVDRALDTEGSLYSWPALYSNAETRQAWENAVVKNIPKLISDQLGGDLIVIDNVLIQKPSVPGALKKELEGNEAALLAAKTAQTNINAAKDFPGGLVAYQAYQQALAVNDAIKTGKVKVLPIPSGSPIIVSPGN